MRVMVLIKASADSEAGVMPDAGRMTAMGQYNEALMNAGILLGGEGLHPSSRGCRVRFEGASRTVTDGPFAEARELVAGFWLWQVRSMDEAVEWLKRCPAPMPEPCEVEIRRVFEAEDFGAAENSPFTPELRAQEEALRVRLDAGAR